MVTITKRTDKFGKVKVFYRVKDGGAYLKDFKKKSDAKKFKKRFMAGKVKL